MLKGEKNDLLGRRGQSAFHRLAEDAGLLPHKPDPDLVGVDWVVDFRPGEEVARFDQRPPAQSVIVQVKTTSVPTGRVRVALSVAERLVKDNRPAVICILRVDANDNFSDMHFVHLSGPQLERVMRRLTVASKPRQRPLHIQEMTFRPSDGFAVDLNPAAVLAARLTE